MAADRVSPRWVRRGPVRAVPRRLLAAMLLVECAAAALVVTGAMTLPPVDLRTVVLLVTLVAAGVVHTEFVAGTERTYRSAARAHQVNVASVWTFAGALLLPPTLGAVLVVVVHLHLYLRVLRPVPAPRRRPLHREVFDAAATILAVHAAAAVLAASRSDGPTWAVPPTLALALALAVYVAVNTGLALGVAALGSRTPPRARILFEGDEFALELATLCVGALTAAALASTSPLVVLLAVPPILVLHRTILIRQLRERADLDAKTGLLNNDAWHVRSARALQLAERDRLHAALLILDLDHFKQINDTHGHLYGDEVLSAIARELRDELRDHDLVGRFGGEEFVVLLPRLAGHGDVGAELHQIAERLRTRISGTPRNGRPGGGLRITVSIGGAVFPGDGADLTALLEIADVALYAAKHAGRDTVRIGRQPG